MTEPLIHFTTDGSSLKDCNDAAAAIALAALGDWYHLTAESYHAEIQTNDNRVLVWRGEYSAKRGGPR